MGKLRQEKRFGIHSEATTVFLGKVGSQERTSFLINKVGLNVIHKMLTWSVAFIEEGGCEIVGHILHNPKDSCAIIRELLSYTNIHRRDAICRIQFIVGNSKEFLSTHSFLQA